MEKVLNTQQTLSKVYQLLCKQAKEINSSSNDMQGSPYWNNCKRYIKIWFKQNDITEISVNDFAKITGFKKEIAFKMLIEINKEIFNKQ